MITEISSNVNVNGTVASLCGNTIETDKRTELDTPLCRINAMLSSPYIKHARKILNEHYSFLIEFTKHIRNKNAHHEDHDDNLYREMIEEIANSKENLFPDNRYVTIYEDLAFNPEFDIQEGPRTNQWSASNPITDLTMSAFNISVKADKGLDPRLYPQTQLKKKKRL